MLFREVRRVLRDDGTVWLNLGDSYQRVRRSRHQSLIIMESLRSLVLIRNMRGGNKHIKEN
jgi:hypothetical protein